MPGELLLDTSGLVGLLDRSQNIHQACVDFYETWEGRVISTEAVLTESTHLLSDEPRGRSACIDFILKGGVVFVPSTEVSLLRCRDLINKYADLPMDFADATLVVLQKSSTPISSLPLIATSMCTAFGGESGFESFQSSDLLPGWPARSVSGIGGNSGQTRISPPISAYSRHGLLQLG